MAALSITPANVGLYDSTTENERVNAGESVTQGQVVYFKTADGEYYLADANGAGDEDEFARGLVISPGGDGVPIIIATGGEVNIGATVSVGVAYYVGNTPGSIVPYSDLTSGSKVTLVGVGSASGRLRLHFWASEVAVP